MLSEQTISKLRDLLGQRDAIDKEISDLIGGGTLPIKKSRKARLPRKTVPVLKPKAPRKKWTRIKREIEYQCLDCKEHFKSNLPKLDVTCPSCNSIQIVSLANPK